MQVVLPLQEQGYQSDVGKGAGHVGRRERGRNVNGWVYKKGEVVWFMVTRCSVVVYGIWHMVYKRGDQGQRRQWVAVTKAAALSFDYNGI